MAEEGKGKGRGRGKEKERKREWRLERGGNWQQGTEGQVKHRPKQVWGTLAARYQSVISKYTTSIHTTPKWSKYQ